MSADTGAKSSFANRTIPVCAGIGLRSPHHEELLETLPDVGWVEAHSENYFGEGGPALHYLEQIRRHYPLSLHGVGLSLGGVDPLDRGHLQHLKALVQRFEPDFVSEHLSWGRIDGHHFNDLLPLPYTEEALQHFCDRVSELQDFLGRQVLVENPSSYLRWEKEQIPEWEFYAEIPKRTGCALLLDVNNIHVSCSNHGYDEKLYIRAIDSDDVREYHLAGHAVNLVGESQVLIDDHGAPVHPHVWDLYRFTVDVHGPRPTLIEWDTDIPPLSILVREAAEADRRVQQLLNAKVA